MKRLACLLAVAACLGCAPAQALNILLSNDDGYDHPNIRAVYRALHAQGHTVKIAAPYSEQSARGGAFIYGRATEIGRDPDPAYPDSYYLTTHESGPCTSPACAGQTVDIRVSGTPVMAVLMGLSQLMPAPDLVIVGPNPGNNLGTLNAASGTYNAATTALLAGFPTLAVSTDLKEQAPDQVARLVAGLVEALEHHRQADGALLPKGVGLNINFPPLASLKGVRMTRIGSYVPFTALYTDDLGKLFPNAAGKPGISFRYAPPATAEQQDDEAVWLAKGYVTISPFDGRVASPDAANAVRPLADPRWLSLPAPTP